MEIRHLRYFIAVAEERSFSKAARRLRIAQPPLSMQIKTLEEDLGVKLLDRTQRPITVTPAGFTFLLDARRILADLDASEARAKRSGSGEVGILKISFIPALANDLLAEIVRTFRTRYPSVEVVLSEMPSSVQVRALEKGEIDVGFLRRAAGAEGFPCQTVCENPLVLAVPVRHPLRRQRPLHWEHLAQVPLIVLDWQISSGFYDQFLLKCGRSNIRSGDFQIVSDMHTAFWMVSAGFGVAPTIDFMTGESRRNVAFIELPKDAPTVEIVMARAHGPVNPIVGKFFAVAAELLKSGLS